MIVTINTDASWIEGYGGFAFWIVCNQGKLQRAGVLKGKLKDSTDAEIRCIANALHLLFQQNFTGISKVIVNTDSKGSIYVMTGKIRSFKDQVMRDVVDEARITMMEICLKHGKSIRDVNKVFDFRHVKAHTNVKDARSAVNRWCDVEARKWARQAKERSKR